MNEAGFQKQSIADSRRAGTARGAGAGGAPYLPRNPPEGDVDEILDAVRAAAPM